jgi:hypothetical protein
LIVVIDSGGKELERGAWESTYVRKKNLEVNAEIAKMMVFNKRKMKSEGWKLEGKKIERVCGK